MGVIAGAFATSHVLMSPEGIESQARRVYEGMKEIGRRVRAARPDVLVIVSSDHLMNFKLELQVPLIIGAADDYEPWGDMDIPKIRFPGHREFSEGLLAFAWSQGIDIAKAAELRPDHGLAIPNAIVNPEGKIPVVPLLINTAMTPVPSPRRGWAVGDLLRRYVAEMRPVDERVVLLGAGGLSHWICMERQGEVNVSWDHWVMDTIISGRGAELAALSSDDILERGGNGGLEVINWICMAGAVPGARGERIYYEPVPEWLTGMGGIAMHLDAPERVA